MVQCNIFCIGKYKCLLGLKSHEFFTFIFQLNVLVVILFRISVKKGRSDYAGGNAVDTCEIMGMAAETSDINGSGRCISCAVLSNFGSARCIHCAV